MTKLLPVKILIIIWTVVLLSCLFIPKDLVEHFWGDTRIFTVPTLVWIFSCITAFWAGSFMERTLYVGTTKISKNPWHETSVVVPCKKLEKSLKVLKLLLLLVGCVILFRFTWCIYLMGSIKDTLVYMLTDPVHFKFTHWQKTNIHGIGMIADLVVSCSIFSFAAVALVQKYQSNIAKVEACGYDQDNIATLKKVATRLLVGSLILLAFYLLLSNERIAFVGGLLGGIFTYILIQRRFPIKKLFYLGLFLIFIWVFIEAGRRQFFGSKSFTYIIEYAKNQLLLYFVAGLRNIDTVLSYLSNHSYGWYTFNFLISPFKLDDILFSTQSIYGFSPYQVRPGYAVIPIFGTSFADYGLAGLWYFILFGFIYQKLHRNALIKNSFLANQIYGYFLVALLLSFVVFLPTLSRFWVNIFGLIIINSSFRFGNLLSFREALTIK